MKKVDSSQGLLIIGSGSQARYVIDTARERKIKLLGIVDVEKKESIGKTVNGVKIVCTLGDVKKLYPPSACRAIVAYGNNQKKKDIVAFLSGSSYKFGSSISPFAYISPTAEIGDGCIINANVSVMSNAKIGRHVIIHSQTVIEHDNEIQDFVNIAPGVTLAGRVTVHEGAYLYTGASVIPDMSIGSWAVVGAGGVVTSPVPDRSTAVGIPAKPLDRK